MINMESSHLLIWLQYQTIPTFFELFKFECGIEEKRISLKPKSVKWRMARTVRTRRWWRRRCHRSRRWLLTISCETYSHWQGSSSIKASRPRPSKRYYLFHLILLYLLSLFGLQMINYSLSSWLNGPFLFFLMHFLFYFLFRFPVWFFISEL